MKTVYYTYLWLRTDGSPYYVGKGKGRRAYTSFVGHRPPQDRSRILVQEFPSESDAIQAEILLIAYYGRRDLGTGCLRNCTDGGEGLSGYRHSKETRELMRKSHKESVRAITHLQKMQQEYWKRPEAKVHLQEMQENNRGSHLSIKARHKIRTSRLGKKYPRKKLSIEDQVALEGLRSLCSVD